MGRSQADAATAKAAARRQTRAHSWPASEPQDPDTELFENPWVRTLLLAHRDPPAEAWDAASASQPDPPRGGSFSVPVILIVQRRAGLVEQGVLLTQEESLLRMHAIYCYASQGWAAIAKTSQQLRAAERAQKAAADRPPSGHTPAGVVRAAFEKVVRDLVDEVLHAVAEVERRAIAHINASMALSREQLLAAVNDFLEPNTSTLFQRPDEWATEDIKLKRLPLVRLKTNGPAVADLLQLLTDLAPLDKEVLAAEKELTALERKASPRQKFPVYVSKEVFSRARQRVAAAKAARAQRIQLTAVRWPLAIRLVHIGPPPPDQAGSPEPAQYRSRLTATIKASIEKTAGSMDGLRRQVNKRVVPPIRTLSDPVLADEDRDPFAALLLMEKSRRGVWAYPRLIGKVLDDLGHPPGSLVRKAVTSAETGIQLPWYVSLFGELLTTAAERAPIPYLPIALKVWRVGSGLTEKAAAFADQENAAYAILNPDEAIEDPPDLKSILIDMALAKLNSKAVGKAESKLIGMAVDEAAKRLLEDTTHQAQQAWIEIAKTSTETAVGMAVGAVKERVGSLITEPSFGPGDGIESLPVTPEAYVAAFVSLLIDELPERATVGTSLLPRLAAAQSFRVREALARWRDTWWVMQHARRSPLALADAAYAGEVLADELERAERFFPASFEPVRGRDVARIRERAALLTKAVDALAPPPDPQSGPFPIVGYGALVCDAPVPPIRELARLEHAVAGAQPATGPGRGHGPWIDDTLRWEALQVLGRWREAIVATDLSATGPDGRSQPARAVAKALRRILDQLISGTNRQVGPAALSRKRTNWYLVEEIDPALQALPATEPASPIGAPPEAPGTRPLDPGALIATVEEKVLLRPWCPHAEFYHRHLFPALIRDTDGWRRLVHLLDAALPRPKEGAIPSTNQTARTKQIDAATVERVVVLLSDLLTTGSAQYHHRWLEAKRHADLTAARLNSGRVQPAGMAGQRPVRSSAWRTVALLPEPDAPVGPSATVDPRPVAGASILIVNEQLRRAHIIFAAEHKGPMVARRTVAALMRAQAAQVRGTVTVGGVDYQVAENPEAEALTFRVFTALWTDGSALKTPGRVEKVDVSGPLTPELGKERSGGDRIEIARFAGLLVRAAQELTAR